MSNDGKLFEELIYNKYMSESKYIDEEFNTVRNYIVKKNYFVYDSKSGNNRQVDIAIFIESYEGTKFIAVECKNHKAVIDVQELESFICKLDGINASKGIMVSTSGFTKGARELARKSRGIELQLMNLEELQEYLYHDYKFYNGECGICRYKADFWTGKKLNSLVMYHNFDNVLTNKGQFLKIYNGSCDNCFTINFLNEKCGSITPVLYLGNSCNYYCKQKEVSCSDNCGLVYKIDEYGNISYFYKGEACNIVNSGHVDF